MINHRISAVWSTNKPIAAFSCTPRVQEVHTKAEVVHLTPGLLGLGVLFTAEFIGQRRINRYLRYSSWCMLAQAYSTCRASTAPRPLHSTPTAMVSTNNNVFAPYLLILGIN